MFKSLRLTWIQRLLKNDDDEDDNWPGISNFFLTNMGVLTLSYAPTDKKFLKDSDTIVLQGYLIFFPGPEKSS